VIIDGLAKSVSYEVGDSEEKVKRLGNSWNAVYCDGSWRFVFPLWACSGVSGYSSGLYTKVETKGIHCLTHHYIVSNTNQRSVALD